MPRVAVYTLRIMGPDFDRPEWADVADLRVATEEFDARNQEVVDGIGRALSEAEHAINLALPEGYYAKIDGGS